MNNQDKCTICLQDFTEMYSLKMCNHSFCKECISKNVSFNLKCPLCRSNINQSDLNQICHEEEELNYTDRFLINLGMESDLDLMEEIEQLQQEHQIEEQRIYLEQERIYQEHLIEEHQIEEYLEQERQIKYEEKLMEELEIDRQVEEYLEQERIYLQQERQQKLMEELEIDRQIEEYLEQERQCINFTFF